jgi:hypothetical protein
MAVPTLPTEFFTPQSMLTLTGATGIVFVIVNGVKTAFDFNPKWFGLLVSQVISLVGVALSGGHGLSYFVGVINGFLIFSTAAGVSSVGGPRESTVTRGEPAPGSPASGAVLEAQDLREGHRPGEKRRAKFWGAWF